MAREKRSRWGRRASFALLLWVPLSYGWAAEAPCRPLPGIGTLLKPGAVVLLGEMHGTNESPAFLGDVVCHALTAELSVTAGLEIPHEEEARISAYLSSRGLPEDRAALLAGPFWQSEFQDGRRSEAMLGLLDRLRRYRADAGDPKKVRVVLLDQESQEERDRGMAERLRAAVAASPKDFFVTLTGNLHNRMARGTPWDAGYEPMGYCLIREPRIAVTSLDVAHAGGTAWICFGPQPSDCKLQPLKERTANEKAGVSVGGEAASSGYDGIYRVGKVTASPPARGLPPPA